MIEKPGGEGGVAKPYMYMTIEETERFKIRLERKGEDKSEKCRGVLQIQQCRAHVGFLRKGGNPLCTD